MSATPSVFDHNQVTTENFAEAYVNIVDKVTSADYIAIDTEFTGFGSRLAPNLDHRYLAMRDIVRSHSLLSLGITTITKTDVGNGVPEYHFDNFEILLKNDERFTVDPRNMQFLAQNGFDFNRLFSVGLPYRAGAYKQGERRNVRDMLFEILYHVKTKRIPLIVHNGFLDLMYFYHSFVTELPPQCHTFTADLVELFPGGIFDTKHLSQTVLEEQKTFLAYLYCKFKRAQDSKKEEEVLFTALIEPKIPATGRKRRLTFDDDRESKRRKKTQNASGESDGICNQYANYGICSRGAQCTLSHDMDRILDRDEKKEAEKDVDKDSVKDTKTKEPEVVKEQGKHKEAECRSTAQQDTSEEDEKEGFDFEAAVYKKDEVDPNKRFDHAAHFDAFMTGFIFCHMARQLGDQALNSHINNLYLMKFDVPLKLAQNVFAKPSKSWVEASRHIESMGKEVGSDTYLDD